MLNFILQAGATVANVTAAADSLANTPVTTGIQTAATNTAVTETKMPLIEMVMNGGPIMVPIALLLLISIYILVERSLVMAKASKKSENLVLSLKETIHNGNIANARAMCKNINTPESIMIEQGVSRIGQPVEEIREAMDKSGANEIAKLEKNLNVVNIIGRVAPMFGFIGTILGIIKIFYQIKLDKTVNIETISGGLYEKMVSSCSGLIVGVIAFIFYYWLNARIDKLSHRMEDTQIRFLDMLNEPAK